MALLPSVLLTASCLFVAQPPTQRGPRRTEQQLGKQFALPPVCSVDEGQVGESLAHWFKQFMRDFSESATQKWILLGTDKSKTGERELRFVCDPGPVLVTGPGEQKHGQSRYIVLFNKTARQEHQSFYPPPQQSPLPSTQSHPCWHLPTSRLWFLLDHAVSASLLKDRQWKN